MGVRAGGTRNRGELQCENKKKEGGDSRWGEHKKRSGFAAREQVNRRNCEGSRWGHTKKEVMFQHEKMIREESMGFS